MRKIRSGKTTFFVANQDSIDALSEHEIKALAEETEVLVERNKSLAAEIKAASAGVLLFQPTLCPRASVGNNEGGRERRLHICVLFLRLLLSFRRTRTNQEHTYRRRARNTD